MANVGTLMVTIDGETFKLQRQLKKAETQMKRFTSRTTGGLGKIIAFARRAKFAIAAIGGVVVILAFKKTISEFVKFEDAALDLQKVMTEAEGSVSQFFGLTEQLSKKFGKSAAEVLQGAANFKQAGFTVQEAFELQEIALKAATVSELSVVDSSKALIRILKGFKAPASEATRLLDILNEVSNKYATTLGELAIGMAQLSPVAKLMGFTFEETAAILTPIIEVFGSGSEAAVAMRTSLLRLVSTQSKVQQTLAALQISQRNANGSFREGRDILFDLMETFQFLDENQKIFVAQQLVGIRQAARFIETANGLNKVLRIQRDALNAVGSADKEVAIRLASLGIKLASTREAFNNMARTIGAFFAPTIGKATEKMKDFMESFKEAGDLHDFALLMKDIGNLMIWVASTIGKVGMATISTLARIQRARANIGLKFDPQALGNLEKGNIKNIDFLTSTGQISGIPIIDQLAKSLIGRPADRGGARGQQIRDNINAMAAAVGDAEEEISKASEAFEVMKLKGNDTMLTITAATTGWGSQFGRTLTDIMFGAEFTFRNIAESFARMISEMIIQLTIIKPLMEGVLGIVSKVGTALITGGLSQGDLFPTVTTAGKQDVIGMLSASEGFSFKHGGIVPGEFGKPVPIIAHGGEEFLGVGQSSNNDRPIELTVILQNPIDPSVFQMKDEEVVSIIADNYARGAIIRKVIREDIG